MKKIYLSICVVILTTSVFAQIENEKNNVKINNLNKFYEIQAMAIYKYGNHYTAPRFHLNGTNGESVYLTTQDYIDIRTFLVFRLSSTGMFSSAPDEIVMLYPNGGETLTSGEEYYIKWKTYGTVATVDVDVAIGNNTSDDDWEAIASDEENVDSLSWTPTTESDSIRIRIRDPDSYNEQTGKYKTEDISGWYFSVTGGRAAKITGVKTENVFNGKGFNK